MVTRRENPEDKEKSQKKLRQPQRMEMMKTTKAEELVQSQMRREIKSFDDEDVG